jgi:hypothetical protein
MPERCRTEHIDGRPVRVMGRGPLTDADHQALAAIVQHLSNRKEQTVPRFCKKPIATTAVQVRWSTWNSLSCELGDEFNAAFWAANPDGAREISADEASDTCGEPGPTYIAFEVYTAHGDLATVRHGDWVVPEAQPGRFYPIKPDVFADSYEPVGPDSPLVTHARRELELSGQYADSPQYAESIIRAVAAFASYGGHSGGSASVAREQLHRLLNGENLAPLTSDPAEWEDRSEETGKPFWQNNRNSKAFSEDGGQTWWLIDTAHETTALPAARSARDSAAYAEQAWTETDRVRADRGDAIADLAQAIRLTREYVGADLLPAIEGWSWYDALKRHAPGLLEAIIAADNAPPPVIEPSMLADSDGQAR